VHDPTLFTLDVAMNPTTASDARVREPVAVASPIDHGFRGLGFPYIATSQLLWHCGIEPATIGGATELLTAIRGNVLLLDTTVRPTAASRRPTSSRSTSRPTRRLPRRS
jgi:hypothetical protein